MRTKDLKLKIQFYIAVIMLVLLTGCGNVTEPSVLEQEENSAQPDTSPQETGAEITMQEMKARDAVGEMDLYLLVKWSTEEQKVRLYRYKTGIEYEYRYGDSTLFRDKYGDYARQSDFIPGTIVHIGGTDSFGNLTKLQMADEVWVYEDVSRFSIDEERGFFEIADARYQWEKDLYVFSHDERIKLEDIGSQDKISVTGYGNTILSVVITQGQGSLSLTNTELFEGSLLQLGTKIYMEITENMTVNVPEGTYILSVANNGWGGSTEITIKRGETTSLDLNTIKGDGPQYAKIRFVIDIPDATLYIDGKEADHNMLQRVIYGKHNITVEADAYETWSRDLYVNSEEATIEIELSEEEEKTEKEKTGEEKTEEESETEDSSEDDSQSESEKREEEKEDALEEYYTTLTDMIESMT